MFLINSVHRLNCLSIFCKLLFILCFTNVNTSTGQTKNDSISIDMDRPAFHFTPLKNFMNDPNGLIYFKKKYHIFYQHNPLENKWGHMSWGHATSKDLMKWVHHPVAIPEDPKFMIYSGSVVNERKNVTGLGNGKPLLAAFYTAHTWEKETQNLAYSTDEGITWTQYKGNPILDIGKKDFRDPKVFWYEKDQSWIMLVCLPYEHSVLFYKSADLINWKKTGEFAKEGYIEGIWECPDLFLLPVEGSMERKWVLTVSVGGKFIYNGSGQQYFIGDFDGNKFSNLYPKDTVRPIDYGKDFYAGVTFNNSKERIMIGWMNNWEYAGDLPTHPWKGTMSLPRRLALRKIDGLYNLTQTPHSSLKKVDGKKYNFKSQTINQINQQLKSQQIKGKLSDVEIIAPADKNWGLKIRKGVTEETMVRYDPTSGKIYLDRSNSGAKVFKNSIDTFSAPLSGRGGNIKLQIISDVNCIEIFANDGEKVISSLFFPAAESNQFEFYSSDEDLTIEKVTIKILKSKE